MCRLPATRPHIRRQQKRHRKTTQPRRQRTREPAIQPPQQRTLTPHKLPPSQPTIRVLIKPRRIRTQQLSARHTRRSRKSTRNIHELQGIRQRTPNKAQPSPQRRQRRKVQYTRPQSAHTRLILHSHTPWQSTQQARRLRQQRIQQHITKARLIHLQHNPSLPTQQQPSQRTRLRRTIPKQDPRRDQQALRRAHPSHTTTPQLPSRHVHTKGRGHQSPRRHERDMHNVRKSHGQRLMPTKTQPQTNGTDQGAEHRHQTSTAHSKNVV